MVDLPRTSRTGNVITQEQVANAIIHLMRGPNGDGQVDTSLASTIAGQVLPDIVKQFAGLDPAQLTSQPSFLSMLQLRFAASPQPDERAVAVAAARANITSADYAAAERAGGERGHAAHGRFHAFVTGAYIEGRGMPSLDPVNGNMTIEQARNIAAARSLASELGMGWAANNPDLLKLGPAAIRAIAETNLKVTGYNALRRGAHYEANDIVVFARHSKLRGFDAEKAAKSTEALVQALPSAEQRQTADVLKRFDHAAAAYYANPSDAAARERFEAAGRAQKERMEEIARRSEADRARVQRLEDDKRVEQRFRATVASNEARADVRAATSGAKVDDLDAIGAPPSPPAGAGPQTRATDAGSPPAPAGSPAPAPIAAAGAPPAPAAPSNVAAAPSTPAAPPSGNQPPTPAATQTAAAAPKAPAPKPA